MDGRTVAFAGVATTQNELTGLQFRDNFDKADIKGANGRTVTRGATNRRQTITIDILYKSDAGGPTRALADAVTALPAMFGIVTLGGFNNALIDGTWNYEEGTFQDSNTTERKATLTLSRQETSGGTMAAMTAVT